MAGRGGIGARQQEAPVGDVGHARPHLLTLDDEPVTLPGCPRLDVRQVGPGVGLGEPLTPQVVGGQDPREEPALLGRRAVLHEGGPQHREPAAVDELGRARPRHLLVEDDLLDDRRAPAPELRRPVQPDVAGLAHPLLPRAKLLDLVRGAARRREGAPAEVTGQIGLEPLPELGPEGLLGRGEPEIHRQTSRPSCGHSASAASALTARSGVS